MAGYNYDAGTNQIDKLPFDGFSALSYGQETPADFLSYWSDNPKEIERDGLIFRQYRVGCQYVPEICEAGIEVVSAEFAGEYYDVEPIVRLPIGYVYDFDISGNTLLAVKTGTSRYFSGLFAQNVNTIDISNPESPYLIKTYNLSHEDRPLFTDSQVHVLTMGVSGDDLFVSWSDSTLSVYDFSNPHIPEKIAGNWVPFVSSDMYHNSRTAPMGKEISIIPHGNDTWVYVPVLGNQFAVYKLR